MNMKRKNFVVLFALSVSLAFFCVTVNAQKPSQGGVLNGKAVSLPKPVYPEIAQAAKVSGQVIVSVTIDEGGNVISASAVSGHPLLRAASVEAAKEAKFSPTLLSGQPVKVTGNVVYNFVISMNWLDIGYALANASMSSERNYILSSSVSGSLPTGFDAERETLKTITANNEPKSFEEHTQSIANVISSIQNKLASERKSYWYFSLGVELSKINNQLNNSEALRQNLQNLNQLSLNTPSDIPADVTEAVEKLALHTKTPAAPNTDIIRVLVQNVIAACRRAERSAN